MRKRRVLAIGSLAVALLAIGCGSGESEATSTRPTRPPPTFVPTSPDLLPTAPPATSSTAGPRLPSPTILPTPVGTAPTPAHLVLESRAMETLSIDSTYGRLESVTLASLDQPLGLLVADSMDEPEGPERACQCPCGAACPSCESPATRRLELPAGGRVELDWNGLVRRRANEGGRLCFDAFGPPPGRYLVRACSGLTSEGILGPCGNAIVTLPTSEPITIVIGAAEAPRCPLSPELLDRAARVALSSLEMRGGVPDRLAACQPHAECFSTEADLAYGADAVRGLAYTQPAEGAQAPRGCGILVWPHDDRLLVRVFLPLPQGFLGGERFDQELDAEATRILSMRFEQ